MLRIAIGLCGVTVLAQLLSPEDVGLVAMVTVVTGFASMFVDAGLSMATVQRAEITHRQVSNLFWVGAAVGVSVAAGVACLAPLIAWFYGEPRLTAITLVLASSLAAGGFAIQHQALLRRGMQFHSLAVAGVGSQLVGLVAAAGFAWWIYGKSYDYWALILLPVATSFTRVGLTWWRCGWRPGWPRRGAGTLQMVEFGANLTGANTVNYFARNADNLLIGWWWGPEALGVYAQAYKLFLAPLQAVNAPLGSVMVPALSRMAANQDRAVHAYLTVLSGMILFVVPGVAMAAVAADWWVVFVLGPQWAESAPILRWLALAGLLQPLTNSTGWLFIAQDKTRAMLNCRLLLGPLTVLSFIVGLPFGPEGVAACYAVSGVILRAPLLIYWLGRHEIISPRLLVGSVAYAAAPAGAVAAACWVLVAAWPGASPASGAAASLAVTLLAWGIVVTTEPRSRTTLVRGLSVLRTLRGSGTPPVVGSRG